MSREKNFSIDEIIKTFECKKKLCKCKGKSANRQQRESLNWGVERRKSPVGGRYREKNQ